MSNDAFKASAGSIPFNATEREAALTLLRYELRKGSTVEEAAKKYDVPVGFAQKATKPRRRRQRIVTPQFQHLIERLDQMDNAVRLIEARLLALDETIYEMIDSVSKEASPTRTTTTTAVE